MHDTLDLLDSAAPGTTGPASPRYAVTGGAASADDPRLTELVAQLLASADPPRFLDRAAALLERSTPGVLACTLRVRLPDGTSLVGGQRPHRTTGHAAAGRAQLHLPLLTTGRGELIGVLTVEVRDGDVLSASARRRLHALALRCACAALIVPVPVRPPWPPAAGRLRRSQTAPAPRRPAAQPAPA